MEAANKETSKKADRFGSEHPIVNMNLMHVAITMRRQGYK